VDVYRHVTQHVKNIPEGKQIAALFDFDSTLFDGFSALFWEQPLKGYLKPFEFFDFIAAMVSYRGGHGSFFGADEASANNPCGASTL